MLAHEAFRVAEVGGGQDVGAGGAEGLVLSIMDVGRRVKGDAGVAVGLVVPVEELLAELSGVFDAAEAVGEVGAVFEGFEVRFGEGVVVTDVGGSVSWSRRGRPAGTRRVGGHGRAVVGVDGQRATVDVLFDDGVGQQLFGQYGRFPVGDHPADRVARVNI
jgi:hypothetical protein